MRHGWTGKDERLVDPAVMSRDTNTSVQLEDVSRDGSLMAYGLKEGGADEHSIHLLEVKTKKTLEDELPAARYFGSVFAPDGKSIYYARNNKEGTLLFQHVMGTRPSQDILIFGREFRGEPLGPIDLFGPTITDDGHYLVIQIDRGVPARRVDIVFRDLTKPGSTFEVLVWGLDSRFETVYAKGTWFDEDRLQGAEWKDSGRRSRGSCPRRGRRSCRKGQDVIEDWSIVGGKLYVNRLQGREDRYDGVHAGRQAGRQDRLRRDRIGFDGWRGARPIATASSAFESFIRPPTIYRLDTMTGKREVFFQPKIAIRHQPV